MMAPAVFLVCALTSLVCTALLLRGWWVSRARLLLWASLGFAGLTVNNILLVVDRLVVPEGDLSVVRAVTSLVGVATLLFGCLWDVE